jgi:hypothetical protein
MAYGERHMGGGRAASHATSTSLPVYAATSTGGEKTVIKEELKTVACWRLDDVRFKFGSAFVRPESKSELEELKLVRDGNVGAPLSVFGHADPVGDEEFNKTLSGWRAEAVYAVLVRDPARWEKIYVSDGWGQSEIDVMLQATGGGGTQSVQAFQTANGLSADGVAGPQTRATLFAKYMEYLFPQKLEKTEFLGQGADSGGKGDFQGCGEFNPAMVFSLAEYQAHEAAADKTQRNAENGVNRRVLVLFFRPGTAAGGDKWPCPRASEGTSGCRVRFWSDATARRSNQAARREFATTLDTFGCRFYHRLAEASPCEVPSPPPPELDLLVKGKLFWNRTWEFNDETAAFGPEKEYLPGSRVELFIGSTAATLALHEQVFLSDDGEFQFSNVPQVAAAEIKISLEYEGGEVVAVKGKSNHASEAKFEVKKDKVVWHQLALNASLLQGATVADVDLGDVEIVHPAFVDICDGYKSVWHGHKKLVEKTGTDLPICVIFVPEPNTSNASDVMSLHLQDLKDRDVILHEYGHFIGHHVLGGLSNTDYTYNDSPAMSHGPKTTEHYEDAWIEGHATFLSCVLGEDEHYHDGYDTTNDMHLLTDPAPIGPHNESSIQGALWRIHGFHKVDFKQGFWKAFSDLSIRKSDTIFSLYDNWKDHGCPDLDKLVEAYKFFNMEYGCRYRDGAGMFTCVAAPKTFDAAKKEFQTVAELYQAFGTLGGETEVNYEDEFYNRNKQFNPNSLGAGSSWGTIVLVPGKKYIIPERFQVTT